MTVLIPAYEPDMRLIELIQQINTNSNFRIVVVDDGSGDCYENIFDEVRSLGCVVLTHETNKGKGRAMKTGFEYIINHINEKVGVVTADADGQHMVHDIIRIADEISSSTGEIVLGARKFVGKVPLRSAFGNICMRFMFSAASGNKIWDTQTGLRGFPISLLPLILQIDGERFEYEMEMLLEAGNLGYGLKQIFIETIYIAGNKSSHFKPLRDSFRVCLPLLKFSFSSITSAIVDYILLFVFLWLTNTLFLAVVFARVVSSTINFTMNRTLVFNSKTASRPRQSKAFHYYILVCAILLMNYLMLKFFTFIGIPLFWSKLLTECILFFFSYTVQRFVLFKTNPAFEQLLNSSLELKKWKN